MPPGDVCRPGFFVGGLLFCPQLVAADKPELAADKEIGELIEAASI